MIIRSSVWLLVALPACGGLGETLESLWDSPTRYVVKRGDTLGKIAKAHGVTVGELRAWNGIRGDLIEVDQVLVIHAGEADAPASRPRRRTARRSPPPEEGEAPPKLAIRVDGMAGILGTEGPSGDARGIAESARAIGTAGTAEGPGSRTDLGGDGLGGSGTAETIDVARRPPPAPASPDPGSATVDPGLRMPAAKRCLDGPTDVEGERGIAVARGLDEDQLRAGLEPVTSRALSCFQGATGRFDVGLIIDIGCDGRVSEVDVTDSGGLPASTIRCVQQTIRHAGFDAHARPDGLAIALPLTFEF